MIPKSLGNIYESIPFYLNPQQVFFKNSIYILNLLTTNVPHHIETSQQICNANQLTGFYMKGKIGR